MFGLDSFGLWKGPVTGCRENGDVYSASRKSEDFLTMW
jgi:hypothetical protein